MNTLLIPMLVAVAAAVTAQKTNTKPMDTNLSELQKATFGGGCFWCTEAVFLDVKGVSKVESGYSGGQVKNPSYREVCTGTTGHAEATQITFDPALVTYENLLDRGCSRKSPGASQMTRALDRR